MRHHDVTKPGHRDVVSTSVPGPRCASYSCGVPAVIANCSSMASALTTLTTRSASLLVRSSGRMSLPCTPGRSGIGNTIMPGSGVVVEVMRSRVSAVLGVSAAASVGGAVFAFEGVFAVEDRGFDGVGFQVGSSSRYLRYMETALRNRPSYVARLLSFRSTLLLMWNRRSRSSWSRARSTGTS